MAQEMFRPPVNRAMKVLDKSFFQKKVPISAARILDNKNISRCRTELQKSKDILQLDRMSSVLSDPEPSEAQKGRRCILLRPELRDTGDRLPWSPKVSELVKDQVISVIPFELHLDYDYWNYHEIASAILPSAEDDEIPSGFTSVGHVAHLNLRDKYLAYKDIIGQLILDKNPTVRTVINKVDDVGEENEYRTFRYEVLAGPDDMDVEIREADCTFRFNYAKVYWNSRLNTEHERQVAAFQEGEAVCDVMAGIGPFAVPAGKKRVFVWANDLNPDSYTSLEDAVHRNKVRLPLKAILHETRLIALGRRFCQAVQHERTLVHPNRHSCASEGQSFRHNLQEAIKDRSKIVQARSAQDTNATSGFRPLCHEPPSIRYRVPTVLHWTVHRGGQEIAASGFQASNGACLLLQH